jgi:hypothetical protein
MISKFFMSLTHHMICLLLQFDINSVSDWCIANCLRLNTAKTRVLSVIHKKNFLSYNYQICCTTITCTSSIKDRGVFFDFKLHFHNHVDNVFFECIKLLGLIHHITYRFYSLECLYVLYFTLVRSKLEYAPEVSNSIMSTDANKLERIQQKFTSICFYRFFPYVPYNYTIALEKLGLHSLRKRTYYLDALFLFRPNVASNLAPPFSKMFAFMFLPAISGNSHCCALVPLINTVLLLGAPMLPTWWVNISRYLHLEPFLLIAYMLLILDRIYYYH